MEQLVSFHEGTKDAAARAAAVDYAALVACAEAAAESKDSGEYVVPDMYMGC